MNKFLLVLFSLLITNLFTYGQIVNEQVDFNNYISATDNDFVNWFNNGFGLTQITTNGITGGCLTVPATMNWGNDNAVYCSKYIGDSGSYCRTSVSFKYDTTVFSSSGFDRAVSIFLRPQADFNHYIIASVSHQHRIEIITYSWTNSPGPLLNLTHNHWYEFYIQATFSGNPANQVNVSSLVTDMGITGQDPPIPVNSAIGTFNDSILFGDTAIEVSLTATQNGGVKYLDNFKFEGIKSADSCISIPTYIPETPAADFSVFVLDNEMILQGASIESGQVAEIYSLTGKKVFSVLLTGNETRTGIADLSPGIYIARVNTSSSSLTKKFAIFK